MNNRKYLLILGLISTAYIPNAKADLVQCLACSAGTYGKNGKCIKCEKGYYSDNTASTSCKKCNAGTYSSTEGASSCSTCTKGTYSYDGASSCTTCPAGSYCFNGIKQTCEPGTYSSSGASSCSLCPNGQYSSNWGASSCDTCPSTETVKCYKKECSESYIDQWCWNDYHNKGHSSGDCDKYCRKCKKYVDKEKRSYTIKYEVNSEKTQCVEVSRSGQCAYDEHSDYRKY